MRNYFIDVENVHTSFLDLSHNFCSGDRLYLFLINSEENLYIPVEDVELLMNIGVELKVIKCYRGKSKKNALDFQLVSFLGLKIGINMDNNSNEYLIVSNDKGFDPVVEFWKSRGENISRISIE